ncbi:hypothetical protein GCM10009740_00930 [Terrabacter terrae]|uniref:Deoxyribose-phosphate aldolase n=1 Tax=Terrabacter terrae TaxID=318434 RepID=A0ABN2TRM2_9MICO
MNPFEDPGAAPHYDKRWRRQVAVGELAERLDLRRHLPSVDDDALRQGCTLATELGLAAVTCRPEQVSTVVKDLEGSNVAVATGLAFYESPAAPVDQQRLADEARALAERGATELAVVANAERLNVPADSERSSDRFFDAVARLSSLQGEAGFRLRVHLEPCGLTPGQAAAACGRFGQLGVWMVQAGTWAGSRASYRLLAPMREALGARNLLKWTTPVTSHHVMLMAMGVGVDRFNTDDPTTLLRAADRQAQSAPLLVPLPGLDYATVPSPGQRS